MIKISESLMSKIKDDTTERGLLSRPSTYVGAATLPLAALTLLKAKRMGAAYAMLKKPKTNLFGKMFKNKGIEANNKKIHDAIKKDIRKGTILASSGLGLSVGSRILDKTGN
jgi:hypothetical protein